MLRQREQRAVVGDVALIVLAGHRGLHAVVEDLDRHAANRLEGLNMTAQQRLQVLVENVAGEQEARVAQHQAEQPDDPAGAGIIGEVHHKAREVDLGLNTRRRLEAQLVGLRSVFRSDRGQEALHRRIGAGVAELTDLAGQPHGAEFGESDHPLAQKSHERRELAGPPHRPRSVNRRLNAALDVFTHRLWITARPPRDRGDRQPVSMQFQDHHQFSKLDHRRRLPREGMAPMSAQPFSRGEPRLKGWRKCQSRNFQSPQSGRIAGPMTDGASPLETLLQPGAIPGTKPHQTLPKTRHTLRKTPRKLPRHAQAGCHSPLAAP